MKARIINEIVRGKESGIASLGIGKTYVTYVYNKIKSDWPDILNVSYPLNEEPDKKIIPAISTVEKVLDAKSKDILCINVYKTYKEYNSIISQSNKMFKWISNLPQAKILEVDQTEPMDDDIRVIRTTLYWYKEYNLIKLCVHSHEKNKPNKVSISYRFCTLK